MPHPCRLELGFDCGGDRSLNEARPTELAHYLTPLGLNF